MHLRACVCLCARRRRRRLDEWMERVCDSLPVPGAPDGFSVVGTIVVGAGVVGGAVGASVGVDVVGASVGAAAAHIRMLAAAAPALCKEIHPEYPYRPFGTQCVPLGTPWSPRGPLEARPFSANRVPLEYP